MCSNLQRLCLMVFCAMTLALLATAQQTPLRSAPALQFNRDIRPILSEKCWVCHGPDATAKKIKLRLDSEASATAELSRGRRAIVPGQPDRSELVKRITHADSSVRMPPADSGRTLTKREIELLTEWIRQGAKWEAHWSFVALVRPPLPQVKNTAWPKNAIDYFVLARLEQAGLQPAPEADRATLLRRLSLDLTGLPPSAQELDDFLNDRAPNAYEKVVDRLLASPRYGERMAFAWLDAARYADTNGYQIDGERFMWRWRDWVINAFNANKPFDQFTIEQLAGDLLPHSTLGQRIATAFNRNHRQNSEDGLVPEEYAVEYVVDRVDTTSTVFLGLTMGCARCHNHKYDPITQKEYYQLYAYFNSIPEDGRAHNFGNSAPWIAAPTTEQQQRMARLEADIAKAQARLNRLTRTQTAQIERWVKGLKRGEPLQWFPADDLIVRHSLDDKALLRIGGGGGPEYRFRGAIDEVRVYKSAPDAAAVAMLSCAESIPAIAAIPPNKRTEGQQLKLLNAWLDRAASPEIRRSWERWRALKTQKTKLEAEFPTVMVMQELSQPRPARILRRGAYDLPGETVTRGLPASLRAPSAGPQPANRLEFARWLVSPENPLTARVTVNRFWQILFGVGLVKTVEDFGSQGELPSHPELLDWLAVEFREGEGETRRISNLKSQIPNPRSGM